MSYLGDITAGKTIWGFFNTVATATGAPITLAGSPVVSVYKNSTTESTSGVTLNVDYDSRTGMHQWVVDTSSDGTFYAAGNDFKVVLTTGTVDGVSQVGALLGEFSIANRSALRPATADRTLVVDANGLADANAVKLGPSGSGTSQTARDIGASVLLSNGTGTGQVKLASGYVAITLADVAAPTTTLNLSGLTIKTATDVEADTQNIQSRLPAALTGDGNMKSDALMFDGIAPVQTAGKLWVLDGSGNDVANQTTLSAVATDVDTLIAAVADLPEAVRDVDNTSPAANSLGAAVNAAEAPTATENADALLNRDMSAVSDTNARSPLNALRFLRNGFTITPGSPPILHVLKEDDTTDAFTRELATDPNADPITGVS